MAMLSKTLVCLAAFVALVAAAEDSVAFGLTLSEEYAARDPKLSVARNVALYTGLTDVDGPLLDAKRDKLPQELRGASDNQLANRVESIGWGAIGVIDLAKLNIPGAYSTNLSGGTALALGLLAPSKLPHPALKAHVIAFVPQSLAATEDEANAMLKQLLREAFLNSLEPEYTHSTYSIPHNPLFGKAWEETIHVIHGLGCPEDKDTECRVDGAAHHPAFVEKLPAWSGQTGPGYVWANWRKSDVAKFGVADAGAWISGHGSGARRVSSVPEIENALQLIKMTKFTPEWVFVYVPPMQGHPYPAIYNKGEPHYFVEPL